MLIFDVFRLTVRTFRAAFGKSASASSSEPTRPRTGMFSTPISAGLITGAVATGVNCIPLTYWKWDFSNHPFLVFLILVATVYVLCSGPYLVTGSKRSIKGLLRFSVLMTLLFVLPIILIYGLNVYLVYRHFLLAQLAARLVGTPLIGCRLARTYCTAVPRWWGSVLALLGNSPMIFFEVYLSWQWEKGNVSVLNFSRDQLGFYIMTFMISQIGLATLPAWAAEQELRKQLNAPLEPTPPPATIEPTPAPTQA